MGKVRDEGLRRGRWQWTVVSGQKRETDTENKTASVSAGLP